MRIETTALLVYELVNAQNGSWITLYIFPLWSWTEFWCQNIKGWFFLLLRQFLARKFVIIACDELADFRWTKTTNRIEQDSRFIRCEIQIIITEKIMKFLGRMNPQSKRLLTSVAISNRINSELHRYWLAKTILPDSFSDTFPTTTHG